VYALVRLGVNPRFFESSVLSHFCLLIILACLRYPFRLEFSFLLTYLTYLPLIHPPSFHQPAAARSRASTMTSPPPTGAETGTGPILPTTNIPDPRPRPDRRTTGLRIRDWVRSPRSGEARHTRATSHAEPEKTNPDGGRDRDPESSSSDPERRSPPPPRPEPWWKIHFFRGMVNDVKKRAPYYASDWTDAWNYRVVPASVYMFFAK
jgi:hypothetical protein